MASASPHRLVHRWYSFPRHRRSRFSLSGRFLRDFYHGCLSHSRYGHVSFRTCHFSDGTRIRSHPSITQRMARRIFSSASLGISRLSRGVVPSLPLPAPLEYPIRLLCVGWSVANIRLATEVDSLRDFVRMTATPNQALDRTGLSVRSVCLPTASRSLSLGR
jgi:hypothetical protein